MRYIKTIFRTTTNIIHNDNNDDIQSVAGSDECVEIDDDVSIQPIKRKRTSSNGEQIKIFESIAKTFKDNQTKKFEIFQQAMRPQTELELFFASMCKTVEKLGPVEQARVKFEISRIVGNAEIDNLQRMHTQSEVLYSVTSRNDNFDDNFSCDYIIENLNDVPFDVDK